MAPGLWPGAADLTTYCRLRTAEVQLPTYIIVQRCWRRRRQNASPGMHHCSIIDSSLLALTQSCRVWFLAFMPVLIWYHYCDPGLLDNGERRGSSEGLCGCPWFNVGQEGVTAKRCLMEALVTPALKLKGDAEHITALALKMPAC